MGGGGVCVCVGGGFVYCRPLQCGHTMGQNAHGTARHICGDTCISIVIPLWLLMRQ